jgi:hypothetical protein
VKTERTTLTLDPDVASKLREEVRRSGRSFKDVANEALRLGLDSEAKGKPKKPFKIEARSMGLKPGYSLDCTSRLLEELDGPGYR